MPLRSLTHSLTPVKAQKLTLFGGEGVQQWEDVLVGQCVLQAQLPANMLAQLPQSIKEKLAS